jgi:transposase
MARIPSWRTSHEQRVDRCPMGPYPTSSTPTQTARTSQRPYGNGTGGKRKASENPHDRQAGAWHTRAQDHRTINGILYMLRTDCRWQDLPSEYGSPVTCWHRVDQWQMDGIWERIWRAFLSTLDKQGSWTGARLSWMAASSRLKRGSGNRADL